MLKNSQYQKKNSHYLSQRYTTFNGMVLWSLAFLLLKMR